MSVFYELNLLKINSNGEKLILNSDIVSRKKLNHVQSGDVVILKITVLNITAVNSILEKITIRETTTKKTEDLIDVSALGPSYKPKFVQMCLLHDLVSLLLQNVVFVWLHADSSPESV